MTPPRLLASTTSHKAEPLLPTLEVFSRLGLHDIDLNLHPIIEAGVPIDAIEQALAAGRLRVWGLAGGWCDFFHSSPRVEETFRSVAFQVSIAERLGVSLIRLFFGRLPIEQYTPVARDTACRNLTQLSSRHPAIRFVFENHDGASNMPRVCREILERVDRPNIRMNFDAINFERAGVDAVDAVRLLAPFVSHLHLKGLEKGEFCEFGVGDVDLDPVFAVLAAEGYRGAFSVEYEGPFDKTVRLYESVKRARAMVERFFPKGPL